ncbi:MAG: 3-deoxy-7-phosphoheptulonate synthase [Candidatus Nealsonbacteria bacterium]|nr:3-deoxy-7-phosphoheptulonate synthase [Candidatus Nealsonbacteria bacterium]
MIIEMQTAASQDSIRRVIGKIRGLECEAQINAGQEKVVIAVLGRDTGSIATEIFEALPEVERVFRIMQPHKLASRDFQQDKTVVKIGDVEIGGQAVIIIAGPCAVESEEQVLLTARLVKKLGAKILRGGAYKPSTSPFKFQGMGEDGLRILAAAKEETGLKIVTEVLSPRDVELVSECADILQIGARNCQNYDLLEEVGQAGKPILLKRGFGMSITEWLQAADYILRRNNPNLILCERGIKTFEPSTRYTLDISAVPVIKRFSHLPVIVDPSHAAGDRRYVPDMARAAAVIADGLLIEVHPNPMEALKDGPQSLTFSGFTELMADLKRLTAAIGREI